MKLAALTAMFLALATPLSGAAESARATVAQGALDGVTERGVTAFLGVPYAAAPTGERRWKAPAPPESWSAPRIADRAGPACPQTLAPPGGRAQWTDEYMAPASIGVSEDCLTLNIWTPAKINGAPPKPVLPVLFYIHGGALTEGSNAVPVYNGVNLARKGVIVVTVNYRLGALGFLPHPELSAENSGASGNWGLMDQIAALQWLKQNIAAFGGDKTKVTIAGQSAGGTSVNALIASPLARGLFRAGIVESGGIGGTYGPLAAAETVGKTYIESLGVQTVPEARALPLTAIKPTRGSVIADGVVIPAGASPTPAASDVPIMIGANLNEGAPKAVTADQWRTDLQTRYGARVGEALKLYGAETDAAASHAADRENADRGLLAFDTLVARRASSKPVFVYQFSHVEPGPNAAKYGAFHTSEVPYAFATLDRSPGRTFSEIDRRLSDRMSSYWMNFVKTGDPNGAGLPRWPAFDKARQIMQLEARIASRAPDLNLLKAGQPAVAPPRP